MASERSDQRVEADVVLFGPGVVNVGLVCRSDSFKSRTYYVLGIDSQGSHAIIRRNVNVEAPVYLASSIIPAAIVPPPGANHLEVECFGSAPVRLSLKLNGITLLEAEDRTGGALLTATGAGAFVSGSDQATAVIKNAIVRELIVGQ